MTLVVEDDSGIRDLVAELLRDRGHRVEDVGSGDAALKLCRIGLPDLLVVDLNLPGMDGLELCRRVRELPDGHECFILLMTADSHRDLTELLGAGADDYIAKPFALEELEVRLSVAERGVARAVERRAVEVAQREGEQRYRAVVEHSTEAICIVRGDTIVFANRAFAELCGLDDPADVVGLPIDAHIHPEDRAMVRRHALARLRGELAPRRYDVRYVRADGSMRFAELAATRIEFGGQPAGLAVIRDVTERREAERHREALAQSEKMRALAQMASGIAHDFNNQLGLILLHAEMLADMRDDPEALEVGLREILSATHDAAAVVRGLRVFYRPPDEIEIETTVVDLPTIVQEVVALTQPRWKDQAQLHGATILVELHLAPALSISGAAAELREALTNLVFNAVDAMPAGGTLTLETHAEGEQVVLVVSDTGIGMPDEVRVRCFEPFFTTKGEMGSGLGLAMVRGIVERLGGTIAVGSTPGAGTRFTLRFPRAGAGPLAANSPGAPPKPKLRVLVVDDDPRLLGLIEVTLDHAGHRVVTVSDGHAALEQLAVAPVDVLVTDLAMPGMSGAQLAATAKRLHPRMGVVLLSGFGALLADDERPGEVDVVVAKPVSASALQSAVLEAAELAREREDPPE